MAERKGDHQKLKMLYLADILREETDANHGLTMPQLIKLLEAKGVNADRKTLYNDIEELRSYDMDIAAEKSRQTYYKLLKPAFELSELKLLVDSVQVAKFITEDKSRNLIRKLSGLANKYGKSSLDRQSVIPGRIKSGNPEVYATIDRIHQAISEERQISFRYYKWVLNAKGGVTLEERHDYSYQVSPWMLTWDDENYYLVGWDHRDGKDKNFRIDKIKYLEVTDEESEARTRFNGLNKAEYCRSVFGMFGGEQRSITFQGRRDMIGILVDRFGKENLTIYPCKESDEYFTAVAKVAWSNIFLGWVLGLGGGIWITGPDDVVDSIRASIGTFSDIYLK